LGFKDGAGNWTKKANDYGIYSNEDFLNTPYAQEVATNMLLQKNRGYLKSYNLLKYVGTEISGIKITESGLLAAAHLVGIGGLKKALESGDLTSVKDGNGTTAASYMKWFGGYKIDEVKK